ncbi:MAG: hypothetical protein MJZ11_05925 [Lachnospiraceae bacterium]|nr:hypothetical protein [Lachnospiraceae bacterium]
MVSVILIWFYMLITTFINGVFIVSLIGRTKGLRCRFLSSYILAGIGFVTFLSELLSLFMKVGLVANIILVVLSLLWIVLFRKDYVYILSRVKEEISPARIIVIGILFLLFAYGSSHGFMHYDSDLYHAQSIRWIEEYGVVKGLGNLHTRLAYNSASFCLTALYSMSFLNGQSYHVCAGFLAFIIAVLCMDLFKKESIKVFKLSNIVRVVAIYYILTIFDEMVSPASDYFMVLMTFGIMILYMELIEGHETDALPYAFLVLLCLIVISIKVSGALVILLSAYPIYLFIKAKDTGSVIKFSILGIVTVVPFLIRNIILSGYLLYPFPSIDIFDFEYKMPSWVAEFDSHEIQVYGRGYSDVTRYDEPFTRWIGSWFSSLDAVNKVSFLAGLFGIVIFVVLLVKTIVGKEREELPYFIAMGTMNVSFIFFMLTSPNIRYGCVFLYLAPALSIGYLYKRTLARKDNGITVSILVSLFIIYKAVMFGSFLMKDMTSEYLVSQQDYGQYETMSKTVNNIEFFYAKEGDQVGYYPFPSLPVDNDIKMITNEIKDGFAPAFH